MPRRHVLAIAAIASLAMPTRAEDPLPSWNDGASKSAIVAFVEKVTKEGSPGFVPLADRVATFDNDGTLWVEQTTYTQGAFLIARVRALSEKHPEWKDQEPFKSVLAGDMKNVVAQGTTAAMELIAATHSQMTPEEFERIVKDWLASAEHPRYRRRYTELAYLPMLELLAYLRSNGFKTYIVSGGGVDFIRPWSERVYGISPDQVVGSSIKLKYELLEGVPTMIRQPQVDFIDDGPGKPIGIEKQIGKRPIMAFGNSDGDYQMLDWTTAGKGPRFGLIVHHTDAEREWAYDRDSLVGRLSKALDEAPKRGWVVVDMKNDWKTLFAPKR